MTNEDIRHILLDFLLLIFIFNRHNDVLIHNHSFTLQSTAQDTSSTGTTFSIPTKTTFIPTKPVWLSQQT